MTDCVFCKIISGDLSAEKVYEDDNFLCIKDQNQVVPGHSLVIPKKHFETFLDMPDSLGSELSKAIKTSSLKLMKENDCSGFNIVQNNFSVAGQVVPHLHFHILPRKGGDKVPNLY
jgi:histidine triad (HIT) family protein